MTYFGIQLSRRTFLNVRRGDLREKGIGNGIMLRESGTLKGSQNDWSREKAIERVECGGTERKISRTYELRDGIVPGQGDLRERRAPLQGNLREWRTPLQRDLREWRASIQSEHSGGTSSDATTEHWTIIRRTWSRQYDDHRWQSVSSEWNECLIIIIIIDSCYL